MTANYGNGFGEGGRGDRPRRPALPRSGPWRIERRRGEAGSLFSDSEPGAPALRAVRVLDVVSPALVLGSTQPAPAGALPTHLEVVRRRSGGGAVLLAPDAIVWVDVVVPASDPLWDDDVGRAFHWLGETWARALAGLGVTGSVHRGPFVPGPWSRAVCFAGLGAGEVVAPGGGKIVGIAARRTRGWALFQCAVPRVWDGEAYRSLLGLPSEAAMDLRSAAAPVTTADAGQIVDAFLSALP